MLGVNGRLGCGVRAASKRSPAADYVVHLGGVLFQSVPVIAQLLRRLYPLVVNTQYHQKRNLSAEDTQSATLLNLLQSQ